MADLILLIFPIAFLIIFFFKSEKAGKGCVFEDGMGITNAKHIQVFAAFMILLHHLTQAISNYGAINKGPITILNNVGIFFTSIFFFFSGYGLMYQYKTCENYLDGFWKKRFNQILIPFIVTNIVYIMPNGVANYRVINMPDFFSGLAGTTLINTNAWYIVEIGILYLVFYLAFRYVKNKNLSLWIVIAFTLLMITGSLFLGHDKTNLNGHWFKGEWWYNTSIIFPMGLIFGKYGEKFTDWVKKNFTFKFVISIIVFAGTLAVENYVRNKYGYYKETYVDFGYGAKAVTLASQSVSCIAFIFLVAMLCMKVKFDNKILRELSKYILEIYLVQDLFVSVYRGRYAQPDAFVFVIVIVETIAVAILINLLCNAIRKLIFLYSSGKLNDNSSYEIMRDNSIKIKILKVLSAIVAIIAVGAVYSFCYNIYFRFYKNPKIIREEIEKIKSAKVLDEVTIGWFDTEYSSRGPEKIVWQVIYKDDEKILLLSRDVLCGKAYYDLHKETDYENSDLRKLISEKYFYECFEKEERKHILTDENTGDNVFLLSVEEAEKYLSTDELRKTVGTEVAVDSMGAYRHPITGYTWWWLRGSNTGIKAPFVDYNGKISYEGEYVNISYGGVRPAIWFSL